MRDRASGSLSPVRRGEGQGEGLFARGTPRPLTPALSPEYDSTELVEVRGEGDRRSAAITGSNAPRTAAGRGKAYRRTNFAASTNVVISTNAPTATCALAMSAGLRSRTVRAPSDNCVSSSKARSRA